MYCVNGFVYSMTNSSNYNEVMVYSRSMNGMLSRVGGYDTGGKGTGQQIVDPLSSQGSIILSHSDRLLFVVNAGSNSISSFSIEENGNLILIDVVPSNGVMPNSLSIYQDILYVSNRGDDQHPSNISGFQVDCHGRMHKLYNATYALSSPSAKPSCVVFSTKADYLIVSELSSNQFMVFPVHCDGTLGRGVVNASNGAGPFGSLFLRNGVFVVSEAGAASLSTYHITNCLQLHAIAKSIPNQQKATCWVSVDIKEQYAYTSNAGTDTISIYRIDQMGNVNLIKNVLSDPNGRAAPLDSTTPCDGKNLYVLNGNEGTISVFEIRKNGDLVLVQVFANTGLPNIGAQGIASW
ncbi:lactonase family protein [Amedibacillus sp. YH-ame6]